MPPSKLSVFSFINRAMKLQRPNSFCFGLMMENCWIITSDKSKLAFKITPVVCQSGRAFLPPSLCLFLHNCLLIFFIISTSGIQLPAVINTRPLSVSFSALLPLRLLAPRCDGMVINGGVAGGHKAFRHDGKTNKHNWWDEMVEICTESYHRC